MCTKVRRTDGSFDDFAVSPLCKFTPFSAKRNALNGPKVTHFLQQSSERHDLPAQCSCRTLLSRARRTSHTLCKCKRILPRHPSTTRLTHLAYDARRGVCIDGRDGGRAKFPLLFDALTSLQHCLSYVERNLGHRFSERRARSRNLHRTLSIRDRGGILRRCRR